MAAVWEAKAAGAGIMTRQKTETPKKKVDDKDYKAALGRIPDKKVDPWADKR